MYVHLDDLTAPAIMQWLYDELRSRISPNPWMKSAVGGFEHGW